MAKSKAKYQKLFLTEPHHDQCVSLVTHNGESEENQPVTSGEALVRIQGSVGRVVLTGEEMTDMAMQWLRLMGKKIDGW